MSSSFRGTAYDDDGDDDDGDGGDDDDGDDGEDDGGNGDDYDDDDDDDDFSTSGYAMCGLHVKNDYLDSRFNRKARLRRRSGLTKYGDIICGSQ